MACSGIFSDFKEGGKGQIIRDDKGNITEVLGANGKPSAMWGKLSQMSSKEIVAAVSNTYDREYIEALKQFMGENFGRTANDKRLALYSKIYSKPFKENVKKWISVEPVLSDDLTMEVDGKIVHLRGNGSGSHRKTKSSMGETEAIRALDMVLKLNPEKLKSSMVRMLGKTTSEDIQSQLLSAATDNAKELILAKIGSNEHTNGIITAMLIMGYDIHETLDFLQDPHIQRVLAKLQKKKNKEEENKLTSSFVKESGINSASVKTLLGIMEVSNSIMAFGGIRSLSENFKIDSASLDRIFDTLDNKSLYEAITTNKIDKIFEHGESVGIFNAAAIIFYHPQSRMIFKRLYELEEHILPKMFKSRSHIKGFIGERNRTEDAYKKTLKHLASAQLSDFLANPIDGKVMTGTLLDTSGNPTSYSLNTAINREKFVNDFPGYIDDMQAKFLDMGIENLALENMVLVQKPGANKAVISISKYKSGVTDDHFKGAIAASIKELKKVFPGEDPEVTAMKKQLYSNLQLYTLIISGGVMSKATTLELYPEINEDFAHHINTLTDEFYSKVLPKPVENKHKGKKGKKAKDNKRFEGMSDKDVADVLAKEEINETMRYIVLDTLIDSTVKKKQKLTQEEEAAEAKEAQEVAQSAELDSNTRKIPGFHKAPKRTAKSLNGRVYKDGELGVTYLGYEGNFPYRVFDRSSPESNPVEAVSERVSDLPGVTNDMETILAGTGKRIGYPIKLNGRDALVLSYVSKGVFKDKIPKHSYNVLMTLEDGSTEIMEVVAASIMLENPNVGLFAYSIGPMTAALSATLSRHKITKNLRLMHNASSGVKNAKLAGLATANLSEDTEKAIAETGVRLNYTTTSELEIAEMIGFDNVIVADENVDESNMSKMYRDLGKLPSGKSVNNYLIPSIASSKEGFPLRVANNIQNKIEDAIRIADSLNVEEGPIEVLFHVSRNSFQNSGKHILETAFAFLNTNKYGGTYRMEKVTTDISVPIHTYRIVKGAQQIATSEKAADKSFSLNGKSFGVYFNKGKLTIKGSENPAEKTQMLRHAIATGLDGGVFSRSTAIVEHEGGRYLYMKRGDSGFVYSIKETDVNMVEGKKKKDSEEARSPEIMKKFSYIYEKSDSLKSIIAPKAEEVMNKNNKETNVNC